MVIIYANALVKMVMMIIIMIKVIVILKIVYINILVRLVSITPGHVKLDWLPPSKSDRRNDNAAHYQH